MEDLVVMRNGQAVTTSLLIAKSFGQKHKNTLKAIRELISKTPIAERMFVKSIYLDKQNHEEPFFYMSRSGFELLTMDFTNKRDTQIKLQILKAFNSITKNNFKEEKEMRKLQLFNYNGQQLRVLNIDYKPWFIGKDVTKILGYVNSRATLGKNISAEHKQISRIQTNGGRQRLTIIDKTGLYGLLCSTDKLNAQDFGRWVASNVLPVFRKAESRQAPQAKREELTSTVKAPTALEKRVKELERTVAELEEKVVVDDDQYRELLRARRVKMIGVCGDVNSNYYAKGGSDKVFSEFDHDFFEAFKTQRYNRLKAKDFDEAMEFVKKWYPSFMLQREIQRANA